MFEPARPKLRLVPRPVTIELRDGRVMRGVLRIPARETATSLLRKASPFLTVRTSKGELAINRDMIAALLIGDDEKGEEAKRPPKAEAPRLDAVNDDDLTSDPCRMLRVRPGASADELKQAWRARMRQVHPDKLQSRGFSGDVLVAAQREAAMINAAYETLLAQRKAATEAA